jgi:hypothetical protein
MPLGVGYAAQGSITVAFISANCAVFRVAKLACRANTMPAIMVSRTSTTLPLFRHDAARLALHEQIHHRTQQRDDPFFQGSS